MIILQEPELTSSTLGGYPMFLCDLQLDETEVVADPGRSVRHVSARCATVGVSEHIEYTPLCFSFAPGYLLSLYLCFMISIGSHC